ncbi:uncharacterized protein LOC135099538 [Scylla paramamosain]|uniref:uncharacterized protein LOC135099538 n=1 Tax=Scylla paramamosain TaxID=85552 RepID=UPI003082EC38
MRNPYTALHSTTQQYTAIHNHTQPYTAIHRVCVLGGPEPPPPHPWGFLPQEEEEEEEEEEETRVPPGGRDSGDDEPPVLHPLAPKPHPTYHQPHQSPQQPPSPAPHQEHLPQDCLPRPHKTPPPASPVQKERAPHRSRSRSHSCCSTVAPNIATAGEANYQPPN